MELRQLSGQREERSRKSGKTKKNLLRIEADANSIVVGSDRDCENLLLCFCVPCRESRFIQNRGEGFT